MIVTRDALEQRLGELASQCEDPRAGLFGPTSAVWEVNRHSAIFLGAGRAALLQLAHPHVAHAIDQHSETRADPLGRFRRTFLAVFDMVYGDLEHALEAARRVHAIHERVVGTVPETGERYAGNDDEALLWVHATLFDTSLLVFERFVRPLAPELRERYCAESRRFAALFGIPDELLPSDARAFAAYCDRMAAELCVCAPAREIGAFLFRPPGPGLGPLMRAYRALSAGLLPPRLRRSFDLEDAAVERGAQVLSAAARRIEPWLPGPLRHLPGYRAARHRLAGAKPDPLTRLLARALVGLR